MVHDGYPKAKVNTLKHHPSPTKKKADLAGLMDEHPRVFDGVCRVMSGPPYHFSLKDGATPVKMHGSRPVSEPLKKPFREELAEHRGQRHHPESSTRHHNAVDPRRSSGSKKEKWRRILPGLSTAE
jgi:hypothetical protein